MQEAKPERLKEEREYKQIGRGCLKQLQRYGDWEEHETCR